MNINDIILFRYFFIYARTLKMYDKCLFIARFAIPAAKSWRVVSGSEKSGKW